MIRMRRMLVAIKRLGEVRPLAKAASCWGPDVAVKVLVVAGPENRQEGQLMVGEAVNELARKGIPCEGMVQPATDSVAGEIVRQAEAMKATAIVMGSRGLGRVESLVSGSVSHDVLSRTHIPVLITPDGARVAVPPRRVIAAIRGEVDMESILNAAAELPGATVVVVHSMRSFALHVISPRYAELPETSAHLAHSIRDRMRRASIRGSVENLPRRLDVAEAVAEAAERWMADLVVIGCHRPSELGSLIGGSTGHRLLGLAPVPILFARTSAYEPAHAMQSGGLPGVVVRASWAYPPPGAPLEAANRPPLQPGGPSPAVEATDGSDADGGDTGKSREVGGHD